jgi:hypothetical protein
MNIATSFSLKRLSIIVVIFVFGLTLVGCGGLMKKKEQPAEKPAAEQKGSLSRTYTVMDEQGRKAGTISFDFSGGAVLRDENGNVIGTFKPVGSTEAQPSEAQSKPQSTEVKSEPKNSEVQPTPESTEMKSEQQQPESESETETSQLETKAKE